MIAPKTPYLYLSAALVCCALALGFLPQVFTSALGAPAPDVEAAVAQPEAAAPPMTKADAFMRGLSWPDLQPLRAGGHGSSGVNRNANTGCRSTIVAAVPGSPKAAALLDDRTYTDVNEALTDTPLGRDVYKVVDQMPLFPGLKCGKLNDFVERKLCSDKALLTYVYANITYPKKAREKGVQGMAVVTFVVEPHGAITNVKIVRDPGAGLGKEVKRIVKSMAKDHPRWEPGLHKGKPVPVQFALPVKFKLSDC